MILAAVRLQTVLDLTVQHLMLSLGAMLFALALALPLGIVLARTRFRRLAHAAMTAASLVQPVPSLALVALVMTGFLYLKDAIGPWMQETLGVRLSAIGTPAGMVALVAYALLPILRNTYTGIRQVDPAVKEVATGMGMTPRQVLFSVELPLALPVIMAGVRISTVWTVGVATLVSAIGAHSLGDLIFRGLAMASSGVGLVLAGALPAIALALGLDFGLGRVESWLTPRSAPARNDPKRAPQRSRRGQEWT